MFRRSRRCISVRNGIGLVTEDRLIFTKMSARDNIKIGGGSVDRVLELFPSLEPRLDIRGGMLSGGEQQMIALGRALSATHNCYSPTNCRWGLHR